MSFPEKNSMEGARATFCTPACMQNLISWLLPGKLIRRRRFGVKHRATMEAGLKSLQSAALLGYLCWIRCHEAGSRWLPQTGGSGWKHQGFGALPGPQHCWDRGRCPCPSVRIPPAALLGLPRSLPPSAATLPDPCIPPGPRVPSRIRPFPPVGLRHIPNSTGPCAYPDLLGSGVSDGRV